MTDRVKPGSKPYRDQLRTRLIAVGFGDHQLVEQVAADLIGRCRKRPREGWRLAAELSLDEAAARYNTVSGNPRAPMRKARIWDYEQWPASGVRPTMRALKVLAQVYGTSWDQLVDLDDLTQMSEDDRDAYHAVASARRRGLATPGAAVSAAAAPPQARGDDDVVPASGDPSVPAEGIIDDAAEESAQLATWAGSTNVDDDLLEQLDRSLSGIAHAYVYGRPYPLLVRTCRLRNRVRSLLQGRQRPAQTRQLYLVGARACTLLAWMSGDLGNYAAAGDHAWAAWMCAQHADHHGARTWVRATQSKLAFWDGDYVESARLAGDGLRYPPTDSAAALLALLEARAAARLGRVDDAHGALRRWRDERERIPAADQVGGVLGLSSAQQHYLAGSSYLWLRDPTAALAETEQSLTEFDATPIEQRFYGAEMLARVDASRAHLVRHDLDEAIHAVEPVLTLEPDQRLSTFTNNLAHLRTTLATPTYRDSPAAQQLQERIEDYTQTAISKDLELRR